MISTRHHRNHLLSFLGAALLVMGLATASAQDAAEESTPDAATLVSDGAFYLDRGDCSLAQFYYQEALRLDPENAAAQVGKGRALSCQGAYPEAIEAFQAALEIEPENVDALVHLANAYQYQYQADPSAYSGRLADALDTIRRAEAIAPDRASVQNTKGIVLYQLGDLEQARPTLERAADLAASAEDLNNAEKSTLQVNLGRVYRDSEQLELAQQAFRRAVVLDPTSATAHNNLGDIAYRLGDCSTAQYELSQAASLDPTNLSAASNLGIVLFECGDIEASLPRLQQAVQMDGAVFLPPLFTYLARAHLETGQVDEAIRRAQHGALLSEPPSADAYYWLGQAYQRRGSQEDLQRAADAYQRALEIDPTYSAAQEALNTVQ
ncbi:MAG TPA: tetratricopeptide repeat protein [Trueperaceae bacterium]|nr:tetratricopeptide repeat protein [Trueperaceae bacterium]